MRVGPFGAPCLGAAIAALILVGCGAITGIDALSNVGAPGDASAPDDAPPIAVDAARCDEAAPWGLPTRVAELGTADSEEDSDARLSLDELTVYFQSTRDTSTATHRVWTASRLDPSASFGAPSLIDLEPDVSFFDPTVTEDRLTLVVQRGTDGARLQASTRADPGARFGPLADVIGTHVDGDEERDPFFAHDGRLLFTRLSASGSADLYIASGTAGAGFSATALDRVNTERLERNAVLSADGRRLFFSSDRDGEPGVQRIFTATRADPATPFGEPSAVAELAVPGGTHDYDAPTWLSSDGCVLYLTSNREAAVVRGPVHIFVARRPR